MRAGSMLVRSPWYRKGTSVFRLGYSARYRRRKSTELILKLPFYPPPFVLELDTYTWLDFIVAARCRAGNVTVRNRL